MAPQQHHPPSDRGWRLPSCAGHTPSAFSPSPHTASLPSPHLCTLLPAHAQAPFLLVLVPQAFSPSGTSSADALPLKTLIPPQTASNPLRRSPWGGAVLLTSTSCSRFPITIKDSQFTSVTQSCPTLCDPIGCTMPGFPVHHQLPELAQTQVHQVGDAIQPSAMTLCHPLLLLLSVFPSNRVFSSEAILCIMWPKYWSFNFSINPSNEYSGLISFRINWFDLLAVPGTLKSLL